MSNKRKQKQVIVVKSKERGARTRVTACAWSHDGKMIVGGPFRVKPTRADRPSLHGRLTACLGYQFESRSTKVFKRECACEGYRDD